MDERLAIKEKAENGRKKELKGGSGEQDIEVPSSERKKSERMKELRKRQAERRDDEEERVKQYADAYDVEEVEIETTTLRILMRFRMISTARIKEIIDPYA